MTGFGNIFSHRGPGADFIVGGETTRTAGIMGVGAAGQTCPFNLTDLALPALPASAVPVRTFVNWGWQFDGAPPPIDSISINGNVISGGVNVIDGACDKALGSDMSALGEGVSILVVYELPGEPFRSVDVYCGIVSTESGPTAFTATDTLALTDTYRGGDLRFFVDALDGSVFSDQFFINGINVGGIIPTTVAPGDAWQGTLWGGASALSR